MAVAQVRQMLDAAGFEADSDYVQGLATMFGKYDADGSGGIELCVAATDRALSWPALYAHALPAQYCVVVACRVLT